MMGVCVLMGVCVAVGESSSGSQRVVNTTADGARQGMADTLPARAGSLTGVLCRSVRA